MITEMRESIRQRNQSLTKVDTAARERRIKSYFVSVDNKIGSRHRGITPGRITGFKYDGPPMIDAKSYKQAFLKGDKDALYYCDHAEPKHTSYQMSMTGCQVKGEPATILDYNRTSLAGLVIPDPATMTQSNLKFASMEEEREKMSRKMFQQSGLISLSPRG